MSSTLTYREADNLVYRFQGLSLVAGLAPRPNATNKRLSAFDPTRSFALLDVSSAVGTKALDATDGPPFGGTEG
jgi:hypothetical protein